MSKSGLQNSLLYELKEAGYKEFMTRVGFGPRYHNIDPEKLRAKKQLDSWLDKLDKKIEAGIGMLIIGAVGCGKTTTMAYIARQIYGRYGKIRGYFIDDEFIPERWEPAIPANSIKFISTVTLLASYFERNINDFKVAKVLFLDDLGREYISDYSAANFEDFIEYRYANKLSTFITTNLNKKQLKEHEQFYRTYDRYREMCQVLTIDGGSMRIFRDIDIENDLM